MTDQASTARRVRAALLDLGFTAEGVLDRLGAEALTAIGQDLRQPARRILDHSARGDDRRDRSPTSGDPSSPSSTPQLDTSALDEVIRLFLLDEPVPIGSLPTPLAPDLATLGLITDEDGIARAALDLRPYGEPDTDWYLVSDRGRPERADHVLGLGGASLTLARVTPRAQVGRALDLGCGAGVQTLHAARHAEQIVATDTNPRALQLTALTAALSGVPSETLALREGSLFEPVAGQRFDLVVSNPPFVISPGHRFTYRDAGLSGDDLSRQVVRGAAEHLAPGGRAALLASWLHRPGEVWHERVLSWLADTSVDAWVVQRDVQDVVDYATTWLRDAGTQETDLDTTLDAWLDEFTALEAQAVGFGWVVLVAPDGAATDREPWRLAEDLAGSPRLPDADEVAEFLAGCALAHRSGAVGLLGSDARLAGGVRIVRGSVLASGHEVGEPPCLERPGVIGPGGWRRSEPVPPTLLAALLDPVAEPLGARLDRAAEDAGLDPLDVLPVALARLRELVRVGIVRP